jgi:polyphosphate kinase
MLTDDCIELIKLWFTLTRAEQLRRFIDRQLDPVKRWKLSPVDLASLDKWDDYTGAEAVMFRHTDLPHAPSKVVNGKTKDAPGWKRCAASCRCLAIAAGATR